MSKQLLEPGQRPEEPSTAQTTERTATQATNGTYAPAPVRVPYAEPRRKPWGLTFMTASVLAAVLILALALVGVAALANRSNAQSPASSSTQTAASNSTPVPQIAPPAHQLYNAQAPSTPQGNTVNLTLTVKEVLVSIAPGVAYHAWTFNGTVPGPVLRVRQGQTIHFTLVNDGTMPHSIDFHAAQTPWNVNYQEVAPGKSFSFDWKANYPGVFMYHCGAPTVIYHMANGMYGAIIVDPATGWVPAKEFVLVQSEFYTTQLPDGSYFVDPNKLSAGNPDYVVFNGYANQYKTSPLVARAGERIRIFIVNAGPTLFSAFHVIGAIFSDTYADGNPANHMVGNQTVTVPPGGAMMVELTIPQAGLYPFVTHSFADVGKGAIGILKITP
ncbi:MAG TPA: multicopper oxidase domain-containing protein [Ktedonobacteraceae bacterium]|nr:multicopper oxidase domain-containing protein [Ktedonobacteraceae bacterium]